MLIILFAQIVNSGVTAVPDKRVDLLGDLMKSKNKIYTTIEFVDIAGLVEGANKERTLKSIFSKY